MIKILGTLALCIVAAVTYRMGGSGNYPRFIRGLGLCICVILELLLLGYFHWSIILCAGAMYGFSTTYFKKNGTDATWVNWLFVGLGFSAAVLPLVLVYGLWFGFLIRTLICTILVVMWSETNGNVIWEEGGRGVIPILTLPLLTIGS